MTIEFLTADELLYQAPDELAELMAGGEQELIKCRDRGYIDDLLNCDPDWIRTTGERIAFIEHKLGDIHYVISQHDLDEVHERAIRLLLDDNDSILENVENTWTYFNQHPSIAYRGGKGYAYCIWGIPDSVINPAPKLYYANIIFAQGSDAVPYLKGIDRAGYVRTAAWLANYDDGTYQDIYEPKPANWHETYHIVEVPNAGTYRILWSESYEYVGLEKVLTEDEYKAITLNDPKSLTS